MERRVQRVVENEARFRLLNERLEHHALQKAEGSTDSRGSLGIVCECADVECTRRIDIPLEIYEWVRSESARFAVAPGHDLPQFEDVIREEAAFAVVVKRDEARPAAAALDPRS